MARVLQKVARKTDNIGVKQERGGSRLRDQSVERIKRPKENGRHGVNEVLFDGPSSR